MDLLATDLHSLLDALGIQGRVVICGHSMGGYVAFAYYRKYPDRIRGMILTASRAAPDTPEGKAGRDALAQKVRVVGIEPIVGGMASKLLSPSNVVQKPELVTQVKDIMLKTSPEGMVGALMGMRDRPDSTPTLGLIQVPTLVIHGADDQIVPLDEARAVAAAFREARLEVIPGAGHLPNLERPEKYNHAVSSFLNDFAIK